MDTDKIKQVRAAQQAKLEQEKKDAESKAELGAIIKGNSHVAQTIKSEAEKTRQSVQKVEVTNAQKVEVEHTTDFSPLIKPLEELQKAVKQLPKDIQFPEQETVEEVKVSNLNDYSEQLAEVLSAIKNIELSPRISMPETKVTVPKIDLAPLATKLDKLIEIISKAEKPEATDLSPVENAVNTVRDAISNLRFPVPNYILPYKSTDGKATQITLDADGKLPVSFTGGTSGTQYTDGSTTVANPVGTIQVFDNAGTITAVSDSNPLPVSASVNASITFGETSTNNSTTTPLASGATFTGTGEQNDYANVGVMVKTDNTGTLYFDFSNDGSNWDSTFPVNGFDVAADVSEFHTAVKLGRYFRVRLVNDTGAQSYLRLTTYYGQNFLPSAAPLNQSINDDSDAIISRSVLVGKNDSGSYDNVGITDKGELKVGQDADIDANNSTTTPLGGSATFTGTGTDVSGYGGITVTLFADRDSTDNGMKFQFSTDNTNWDLDVAGGFDYVGSTGRQFQFATQAKYFRVVFENSTVAQSVLRIQTLLHKNPPTITSIHRAADNVKPDRSATLVKSVLMGQVNGSGDLVPVQLSAAGILKTTGSAGGVTDTAYAEDSASGSGDVGSFVLAVRRDTATSGTSADGDYASLNVDSTGRLWTNVSNTVSVDQVNKAYVDTNNSSSATLGSGGIFTGTSTDLTGITNIGIFVRSNVASATGGLEIQFSTDNSTWYTDESYTIAAATEKTFSQGRIARYFRIKYTNGGTAQSSFNLQTTLFTGGRPKPSSHKLESTPISQDDAELVKAQLVAQQPGGAFANIDATTGGNLKVSVQEISDGLDVGAGAAGAETQRVILASDQTVVPVSDNGGSLTVDGTVGVSGTVTVDGSGTTQPISAASLPLPTGAATAANQQTDALTDIELRASPVVVDLGANNDVTVTGTVIANLSATDNAVLDTIDTAVTSKYITGIGHGVKTVTTAGTDVVLAASTTCKKVTIQAQTDNTGLIAVGGSGVDATEATGTGIILYPGDSYEFDIDNLSDIYIDSTVNGEGVRYTYFT